MSGLKFLYKFCARQYSRDSYGLKVLSNRNRVAKATVYNYNTYYNTSPSSLETSVNCHNSGNYVSYRHCIAQAAVEESGPSTTYFQSHMRDRKKQAQRSVLLEVSTKEDIPYALAHCEKYGRIAKVFSYPGESSNCFLLLEFVNESTIQQLLLNCKWKNVVDAFPIFSRLIQFEKKLSSNLPERDIEVIEESFPVSKLKEKTSISDLIENIYLNEKISELNTRLRYFFCNVVKDSISGMFPYCDVLPFGSSVNGIGRHGCDLDVMIRLYPEQLQVKDDRELSFLSKTCVGDIRSLQQKAVFSLGDMIKTFFPGTSSVQKIIHARMPIFKLKHRILKMDCDVSINNMSAVLMSEMIHFCGEVDSRVRPLLYAVKKWAKEAEITYNIPGTYITNFGLTFLVLFFLQNRPTPILPSFNNSLVILGEDATPEFRIQHLKSLEELKMTASLNDESLALLLKEFLSFMGTYSFKTCTISLMTGKAVPRKDGSAIWVQYPFEDLNITKNVSDYEFWDMTEKARISSKYLENNLNQKVSHSKDFSAVLGISTLKKKESSRLKKIDVNALLDSPAKNPKTKVNYRAT